jgi:hypothetical protein
MRTTPYYIVPEFLELSTLNALTLLAMECQQQFMPVSNSSHASSSNLRELGSLAARLHEELARAARDIAPRFDLASFAPGAIDMELTLIGDGGRIDMRSEDAARTRDSLNYILFLPREPRRFRGGMLCLYSNAGECEYEVEPTQDSAIFFPGSVPYTLEPVTVASKKFEDSLLILNGRIRAA